MRKLKNLKIRTMLVSAFTILALLFMAGMAAGLTGLHNSEKDMEAMYEVEFKKSNTSKDMQRDIQSLAKNLSRACTAAVNVQNLGDAEAKQLLADKCESARADLQDIKNSMDELERIGLADMENYSIITENYPALVTLCNEILNDYEQGRIEDGVKLAAGNLDNTASLIGQAVDRITQIAEERATSNFENTQKLIQREITVTMTLAIVILIVMILLSIFITRSITVPLSIMEESAKKIAEGDLSSTIDYQSKNELGHLADSLRKTVHRLNLYISEMQTCLEHIGHGKLNYKSNLEFKGDFILLKKVLDDISENLIHTIMQIDESAEQVTAGSEQIAISAQTLSQATIEQASAVEELSATINDVSDRVRENADNAVASSRLTDTVGEEIAQGSSNVQELSSTMKEMKAMSGEITSIVKEIEDIAFQTNILSLNAAVEASRAGEAGRGFSVVANEIRRLSTKTTEASKSTDKLIRHVVEMMIQGSDMADTTTKQLNEVVHAAQDAVQRAEAISLASNEQATAVVQLRESIEQISSVVQENAATAEESAASSEELSGQMQMLKQLVTSFEFDDAIPHEGT